MVNMVKEISCQQMDEYSKALRMVNVVKEKVVNRRMNTVRS